MYTIKSGAKHSPLFSWGSAALRAWIEDFTSSWVFQCSSRDSTILFSNRRKNIHFPCSYILWAQCKLWLLQIDFVTKTARLLLPFRKVKSRCCGKQRICFQTTFWAHQINAQVYRSIFASGPVVHITCKKFMTSCIVVLRDLNADARVCDSDRTWLGHRMCLCCPVVNDSINEHWSADNKFKIKEMHAMIWS